jgi:hypothetical protein
MRKVLLGVAAVLLAACATITKGTTQLVVIDTPGVAGATCTVTTKTGPQVVTTPGSLTLSKGSDALPISCTKPCYVTGSSAIPSSPEAMAAGNVVFGGIIGLGVDAASGAINKYPDQITVAMIPDRSCRQSPKPSSRLTPKETPTGNQETSDQ